MVTAGLRRFWGGRVAAAGGGDGGRTGAGGGGGARRLSDALLDALRLLGNGSLAFCTRCARRSMHTLPLGLSAFCTRSRGNLGFPAIVRSR